MSRRKPGSVYWSPAIESAARDCQRHMLDAWRTEHVEHRIPTSQGETFVLTAGRKDGPAVVLLPGAMATSAMWLRTMDVLVDRFHVIAVDVIGGAWLALDHAVRRRSRVTRLALLAPAGVGRIRPAFFWKIAPLLLMGAWGHRKAMAFNMGFAAGDPNPDEQRFIELFDTVRSGFVARMQPIPTFTDQDLQKLDMPVLAVVGGRDAIFDSAETVRRMEKQVRRIVVEHLPNAGHGLVDVSRLIRDFLS